MDEEVSGASEETNKQPSSEVCSNPKGGERASRLPCQDCISRAYAHPQLGAILCSDLTINRWRQCARDRFQEQLDYIINLLPEKQHAT